jgi:hypothetical protein
MLTIGGANTTLASSKLIINTNPNNGNPPEIQLGSTNGNNIAVATGSGNYTNIAVAGDMVVRSLSNMYLLCGGTGYAIKIPTTNIVEIPKLAGTTISGNTTCLSSFNVSGLTMLSNNTTCVSSLNISGNTTLQGASTCVSSLNVMGAVNISGTTTVFNSIAGFNQGLQVNGGSQFYNYVTTSSNLNIIGVLTTNNVCIGTTNQSSILTINNLVSDRGGYDHSQAPLTVTHQTPTSNILLNDPLSV